VKKKIVLITSEFPPLPGGIGNHAFFLAKYLQKYNYEVSVLSDYRLEKNDVEFDKQQAFKVIRVRRNFNKYFNRFTEAFSLIKKNEIVIVSGKFSLWLGAFMKCFFLKKKFIAVLHGSEIFAGGKWTKSLTKWSIKKYDKLIAVSQFTKELTLKQNDQLDVIVINNGFSVQENSFYSKIAIKGKPSIVTVGNVTFRKGQQNVIKALPKLKEKFPEIHYHIIGIPTEKRKFEELAKNLNVENCITFHGMLSDEDLKSILSQTNVFFMLSEQLNNGDVEGFGIAVLEANYFGIPAIGSKNSGIADAINDHYSGRLVTPKNSDEVVEAFSEIINNYEKYSKQAKLWSKEFDWSKVIKKYLDVIES
jgi:phosphatidyl-myo-inositol dimannoside synthase